MLDAQRSLLVLEEFPLYRQEEQEQLLAQLSLRNQSRSFFYRKKRINNEPNTFISKQQKNLVREMIFERIHLDKVHGASGDPNSSFQNVLMGLSSLETWQKRRMNVQKSSLPSFDKLLRQNSHKSSKTHNLNARGFKLFRHCVVERFATRIARVNDDLEDLETKSYILHLFV